MPRRIALVTAREALPLDEDMPPLVEALRAAGAEVETPAWDDPTVDWGRFDAVVLRSTWDYMDRLGEFLGWIDRCAGATRLFNAPEVVRWSLDKHYLLELHQAGVPVVPTRFVEPGESPDEAVSAFLDGSLSAGRPEDFDEFVAKPAIGAGSRDALRLSREDTGRAAAHLARLLQAGRSVLLQPYLRRVDEQGETALVHLAGRFSHAIRKAALLKPDGQLVAGLFAPEEITARIPGEDELEVAARACAVVQRQDPLYVRVDLVRNGADRPVVLELEMAEPSLFFAFAPGSAAAFGRALLEASAPSSTPADASATGSPLVMGREPA
jgi:glutathione synthase/RimK-type ligase-like ATP-grasp enzyme